MSTDAILLLCIRSKFKFIKHYDFIRTLAECLIPLILTLACVEGKSPVMVGFFCDKAFQLAGRKSVLLPRCPLVYKDIRAIVRCFKFFDRITQEYFDNNFRGLIVQGTTAAFCIWTNMMDLFSLIAKGSPLRKDWH